jgi:predicted nucleic acid-binding protein
MVLVDTSIWISLYRNRSTQLGQKMWMLAGRNEAAIAGQIWVEFLGGFRKAEVRASFEDKLRAYPFLETSRAAWELAANLLAAHPRLGAGHAIVAATAITCKASLWTADDDFTELAKDGLMLFA